MMMIMMMIIIIIAATTTTEHSSHIISTLASCYSILGSVPSPDALLFFASSVLTGKCWNIASEQRRLFNHMSLPAN
jgi:hypothetical protein